MKERYQSKVVVFLVLTRTEQNKYYCKKDVI